MVGIFITYTHPPCTLSHLYTHPPMYSNSSLDYLYLVPGRRYVDSCRLCSKFKLSLLELSGMAFFFFQSEQGWLNPQTRKLIQTAEHSEAKLTYRSLRHV